MEADRTVTLAEGTVHYREAGQGPPVLFIHGLLVDGSLWRKVVPQLSDRFRCVVPDWPLGAHPEPMSSQAEPSPRGVARLVADFMDVLDLRDVTVVANDTGGAIAQILVTEQPDRVGRLVLTPCDCFENFLPPAFRPLQWAARVPGLLTAAMQGTRVAAVRRSPLGFGLLTERPIPDHVTAAWSRPYLTQSGVRRDVRRFLRAIDSRDTLTAAERLRDFDRPVLLAWAPQDRFFKLRYAQRLAEIIPDARLVEVPDCRTFMSEDQPERLAELIGSFVAETGSADAGGSHPVGSVPAATEPTIGGK